MSPVSRPPAGNRPACSDPDGGLPGREQAGSAQHAGVDQPARADLLVRVAADHLGRPIGPDHGHALGGHPGDGQVLRGDPLPDPDLVPGHEHRDPIVDPQRQQAGDGRAQHDQQDGENREPGPPPARWAR
jgi:hypothetical protein